MSQYVSLFSSFLQFVVEICFAIVLHKLMRKSGPFATIGGKIICWGGEKMDQNRTYGYVRVSARDQNEARQLDAMAAHGVNKKCIFIDKQSGKDFNRPQYRRLLKRLKRGRYPRGQEHRPAWPQL